MTVNHLVAGSSPAPGAKLKRKNGMKKTIFVILFVFMCVGMALAVEAPKDSLTLKAEKMKKPAVIFLHTNHSKECVSCHHMMKEGEVEVKKCTECHLDKKDKTPSAKTAMHKNCKDCHKEMKKKGEKTGPTKCSACHKK